MSNILKIMLTTFLGGMMCACSSNVIKPAIVPGVEVRMPESSKEIKKTQTQVKTPLKLIGAVEPVYFLPMKTPFLSRIDTGAETSSVDVDNVKPFERDGEKWVSFDMVNRENNEKHHFEKKIQRQSRIKRINGGEDRYVVLMNIKMGNEIIKAEFSLAHRDRFEYQGPIGRNILTGRAVVDTSIENTLR